LGNLLGDLVKGKDLDGSIPCNYGVPLFERFTSDLSLEKGCIWVVVELFGDRWGEGEHPNPQIGMGDFLAPGKSIFDGFGGIDRNCKSGLFA
jgi:hypothetical protein